MKSKKISDPIKRSINMKTVIKILTTFVVICFTFTIFLAIYFTSWRDVKINNLNIYYSKVTKECLASWFEWNGDTENMTFTVPDEYKNMKIKSLGGPVGMGTPTSFHIMVPDSMHPEVVSYAGSEECVGVINEDTVTYSFTVKLGKNIRYFDSFPYKEYYMDENDNVIYIVETKYECATENKWAYSKDGKLYDKKTNKLLCEDY